MNTKEIVVSDIQKIREKIKEIKLLILEQEKIAKCLDSLENLIESYERKIEVLNIQKKGLMQKLFPRL